MAGFEALYKQTVTMFNRIKDDNEDEFFIPTLLKGVHLIIDHSAYWNTYGGQQADNVRLHVRYLPDGDAVKIGSKTYVEPKEWKKLTDFNGVITFRYGNDTDFDFFVKGEYTPDNSCLVNSIEIDGKTVTVDGGFISDSFYERYGFYNEINREYDHIFAVTSVSQYNLIPHFEIMAR